uniref:Uncharacterized protein n=1 Tax=Octopus bimaculoides TaxID=37653 RepID=A0A0L8GY08_OCTBM
MPCGCYLTDSLLPLPPPSSPLLHHCTSFLPSFLLLSLPILLTSPCLFPLSSISLSLSLILSLLLPYFSPFPSTIFHFYFFMGVNATDNLCQLEDCNS